MHFASKWDTLRGMPPADARSACPVACLLDLVGDKWTLLVIRDLFLGKSRFEELRASPEGIATNILAARLRRLEELGLVERVPSKTHAARGTYRLTARGLSLKPVLLAMREWGLAHVRGTRAFEPVRPSRGAASAHR